MKIKTLVCLLLLVTTAAAQKSWIKTWEPGEPPAGTPLGFATTNNQRKTECGFTTLPHLGIHKTTSTRSYNGSQSNMTGLDRSLHVNPCIEAVVGAEMTSRLYPTFDGRFNLPVLVRIWIYYEAKDFSFAQNRLSQLTTKGRTTGEILTTHILSDGAIDIGHANEPFDFHDRNVKVPLNKWHLQSLYIENFNGRTIATAWIDTLKAVEATAEQVWVDGQLRHWHAGFYASIDNNNYPTKPALLYNDDMRIDEVRNREHAIGLIRDDFDKPEPPPEGQIVVWTWDPNPEPDLEHYTVFWGHSSRGYSHAQPVVDATFSTRLETGARFFTAVTASDSSGNESEFSDEVTFTTGGDQTAPGKPTGVKIK